MKIKKQKKTFRSDRLWLMLLIVVGIIYVVSSPFIKASSTNYTIEIQKAQNEIEDLKETNDNLSIEIQVLQNKDRVYTIAQESGLTQNQDNVVAIN